MRVWRMRRAPKSIDDQSGQWFDEQRLKAILLEYSLLKDEIRSRSDYQNRLIQLHLTALLAILAVATSGSFSRWIILIIPVESAIFGMWWMDHALSIRSIGGYLASNLETSVDDLLQARHVIYWERRHRHAEIEQNIRDQEKRHENQFEHWWKGLNSIQRWSFFYLPVVITTATLIATIITFVETFVPEGTLHDWAQSIGDTVYDLLPIGNEYEMLKPWILLACLLIQATLLFKFWGMNGEYRALIQEQRDELLKKNGSKA